jgi:hypothetical protein
MSSKVSAALVCFILAIMSTLMITGCSSRDVTIKGRLVESDMGLSNMWVILADYDESDDGYSGYKIRFNLSGEPEHLWTETDLDGSWQINIPAAEAKELGSIVLTVTPAGHVMNAFGSYSRTGEFGMMAYSKMVRNGVAAGQAIKKDGSPIEWRPGRLRGTINLGDIQVKK